MRSSLAQDATFNTASFAVRVVGSLITVAWVARSLGPEGQGRFGFALWVAAALAQIALWGLGSSMVRFVARAVGAGQPEDARHVIDQAGRWLVPTVGGVVGLGIPVVLIFGADLKGPLLAALLVAGVGALTGWRAGAAQGLRRFDVVLAGDLLYWVTLLAVLGPALAHSDPILGVMVAYLAARCTRLAVVWIGSERGLTAVAPRQPDAQAPDELIRELRRFALQMAGLAVFGAILWDRSEVAFLKATGSYEDIGFYTAAFGVAILVTQVPASLGQVLVPFVAEMHGADRGAVAIGAAFRRGARILSMLLAGPIIVLICSAPALVALMYGDEFARSAPLLQLLVLPLLLGGIGATGAKTLVGGGGHAMLLRLTSWGASLKMLLCIALVPGLGVLGAALAWSLSGAVTLTAEGWFASRRFPRAKDAPSARWKPQIGAASLAGAGTLLAAGLVAPLGVDSATGILLIQLTGGGIGWLVGLLVMRPLPASDTAILERLAPAPLRPLIARLGG